MLRIAIIKADDIYEVTPNWTRFLEISKSRGVKVSCGIVSSSLVDAALDYREWLLAEQESGWVEFWDHGWDHQRWREEGKEVFEFCGSGSAHQSDHLRRSQAILRTTLGEAPVAFGAPYNRIDDDTESALRNHINIKIFFGCRTLSVEGIVSALMPLLGEPDGTGKPNFEKFASAYERDACGLSFSALQFHPDAFADDSYFEAYERTLDFLLAEGWTFMLPKEYVGWLEANLAESG